MTAFPHASDFESLVEILDDAAARWPHDRRMYGLRLDSGMAMSWSAQEMQRRSLLAAWRLRAAGLAAGDRLLTWSPSTLHLPDDEYPLSDPYDIETVLQGRVDLIIDGGFGALDETTVVSLVDGDGPVIVREGAGPVDRIF